MKVILIFLVWLMTPIAFVVVAFDIAKAFIEEEVDDRLKDNKNGSTK